MFSFSLTTTARRISNVDFFICYFVCCIIVAMNPRINILMMAFSFMMHWKFRVTNIVQQLEQLERLHRGTLRRRRAAYDRARIVDRRRFLSRQIAVAYGLLSAALLDGCSTDRNVWVRPRIQGQWHQMMTNFSDEEFRQNFRMSRETFEYVAAALRPALERRRTNFRVPIDHKRRLAIVIWWLATPAEYRTISTLFGVGISTLCILARQVCSAIKDILFHRYISLPSGNRLQETITGFQERGFSQCAGAVDGTHLPIIAPKENHADYHNRKGWHSIVLQAIVDHKYWWLFPLFFCSLALSLFYL